MSMGAKQKLALVIIGVVLTIIVQFRSFFGFINETKSSRRSLQLGNAKISSEEATVNVSLTSAALSNASATNPPNLTRASTSSLQKPPTFPITYQLFRNRPYKTSHIGREYACRNRTTGQPIDDRAELPTSNPFEFTTYIQTKLNILFMGDSLAVEFGSWFMIASQATNKTVIETLKWRKSTAEGLAVASAQGGGMAAYWRILGFWQKNYHRRPLPNSGFGLRLNWVSKLLKKLPSKEDKYDVLIFRISHPWLAIEKVTAERMQETIDTARELLGKQLVVVFQTAPMNNNILTSEDLRQFRAMNDLIRSFVVNSNSSDVLLSDVEVYMDNVNAWNAQQMGMTTTNSSSYLMEHLKKGKINLPHHICQVCSEQVPHNSINCKRNLLSKDGMHFCMETLGPRLMANWACLIQCAYDQEEGEERVRDCEGVCSSKYLTLDEPLLADEECSKEM